MNNWVRRVTGAAELVCVCVCVWERRDEAVLVDDIGVE